MLQDNKFKFKLWNIDRYMKEWKSFTLFIISLFVYMHKNEGAQCSRTLYIHKFKINNTIYVYVLVDRGFYRF